MSTSHEATHQQPAERGESGSCCGGHKPELADRAAPPAEAAKAPAPAQPPAKEPKPNPARGGSCGCGH